jgi:predicted ATPase
MDEPHATLWHRCSPEHVFSPFHPVTGLLQEGAGQSVELCCRPRASRAQLKSTPQQRRQRIFELLLARLERLARKQMVLAVYEDLQWADPSTLEFLERMVDRIAKRQVLAVMTFRPEFEVPWQGHAHAVSLALAPLERGPCQAMIQHLSAGETLAEPIVEHIIARSGGVPLLVEELTKAVLEVPGLVKQDGCADAAADEISLALREGLMARLAAAPEAMAIAQIGAMIGCEFSEDLLSAVVDWPQDELESALDQLVASEVVSLGCGPAGETAYVFRHELIREAVYQSIAEPVRRELHSSIAGILEARRPDVAANTPELLAPHYAAAGLAESAVACWLRAGTRAKDQCAHDEAIAMFGKGLELLDRLPAGSAAVQSAQLLAVLAEALTVTKGLAASEVAQACAMARQLCRSAQENPALFPVMRSLWEYFNTRGDVEAACELAEQCQRLAASAQEPGLMAEADFCVGVSSLFAGQLVEARDRLNRSAVRFEVRSRQDPGAAAGRDPRIIALVHLAQVLWLCGYPDQALRVSQEAIEMARAGGHAITTTYALLGASWVSQLRRDVDLTRTLAADAMAVATGEGFAAFLAMAKVLRGWTSVDEEAGDLAATAATVRTALEDYRATGTEIARPYLLGLLAEVHGAQVEVEPALDLLDEAADAANASGERWYEPEIRRQEGELFLRRSITNRRVASARFCQAIAVAQLQGSKSLELRSAVSLARLWAEMGRRSQARNLLAPIYGWFKEGFDTSDLRAAGALLDELR